MYNKRRPAGRRVSRRKRTKPNYIPVIVILCLSIGCGYATAKYVVEPVVNYDAQFTWQQEKAKEETTKNRTSETTISRQTHKNSVVEDDVKVRDTGKIEGYALQFGCYSTAKAAEKVKGTLGLEGLRVLEQNKMYKIVGETYDSKNKAKAKLTELPDTVNAFVTTIYK